MFERVNQVITGAPPGDHRNRQVYVDKRRCARYRLDLPVTYMWRESSGECAHGAGFIRDISANGMLVLGGECPPAEAQVWCEVMLPPSYSRDSIRRLRAAGPLVRIANSPNDEYANGFAIQGSPFLLTAEADKAEWVRLIADQQQARAREQDTGAQAGGSR